MTNFILMLTRDDVTVADAISVYREVARTGVEYVGFKDIGLSFDQMKQLVVAIHADGKRAVLEVVSISEEAELRSARAAIELKVDHLIGGTHWKTVRPFISDTAISYFPYVGTPVGHPAVLEGSVAEIVGQAQALEGQVDGVNLLAYRHQGLDGAALVREVTQSITVPVICAGSVNSLQRIADLSGAGAWAFTIGTAILDKAIISGAPIAEQVQAAVDAAARAVTFDGQVGGAGSDSSPAGQAPAVSHREGQAHG